MNRTPGDDPLLHPAIQSLAGEMARHGSAREAPARAVMGMLGDRWTTLIVLVLQHGDMRHADLRRVIAHLSSEQAISQRVLTLKLRALERDGFVLRAVSGDVPPRVSYSLSPLGADLAARAREMIDWINARADAIHEARARYDSENDWPE